MLCTPPRPAPALHPHSAPALLQDLNKCAPHLYAVAERAFVQDDTAWLEP